MISRLQTRILQLGFSNKDLAEKCGFSPERISDYIHGRRGIPPRHLLALCRELSCNPDTILGHDEFKDFSKKVG